MTTATRRTLPGPPLAPYRNDSLIDWVRSGAAAARTTSDLDVIGLPDEWRTNTPFHAALKLTGVERGQTHARFVWVDHAGHRFPMFMTDACDLMLTHQGVMAGVAHRWWIVVKRGLFYGLAPLADEHAPADGPAPEDTEWRQRHNDLDRGLVRALRERTGPDGEVSLARAAEGFTARSREWIRARLHDANSGTDPLPGVAVTRESGGKWRVTFARRCPTCTVWVGDGMGHPHTLDPAVWE